MAASPELVVLSLVILICYMGLGFTVLWLIRKIRQIQFKCAGEINAELNKSKESRKVPKNKWEMVLKGDRK